MTGAPTPAPSSARASSGTDSSASTAWPTRCGDLGGGHPGGEQLAGAAVAALARERGGDAGRRRRRARSSTPGARRAPRRSARPRRRCARRRRRRRSAPGPRSRRRRARRRSWRRRRARRPTGSSDCSQTTPGAGEHAARASARAPRSLHAATSAAPACTISCACAGPPTQATRSAPKRSPRTIVGGRPCGGTRPLATDTTAVRRAEARLRERGDHLAEAARGHRQEDVVGARDARRGRLDAQRRRQLHARQVAAVLALGLHQRAPARRVRVCSVVRSPPRTSSTASAVPNEPAPMTVARRDPGVGQRARAGARAAGLGVGSGSSI